LCKLDRQGQVMAKTMLAQEDVVVLNDGIYCMTQGARHRMAGGAKFEDLTRGEAGADLRKITEFEVLEGGGVKPVNPDEFARRGHIDFKDFDPTGAWAKLGL
jgi:hypothetical protein